MAHTVRNAVVVITGASSGIGRATAHRFARKAARLVLVARRRGLLEQAAEECRRAGAADVLVIAADTSDEGAVNLVAAQAVERFGRIDVWVNNAAVAAWGKLDELPMGDVRRVFEVGVFGYVHGARAVLPVFKRQGSGVLINVGSMASRVSEPYNAPYSMAKHAVRALSMSLRQELILGGFSDIDVVTVMPATIDTPFFQHSANYTGWAAKAMPPVYTPKRVARAIVRNARRPRREVPVGTMARVGVQQQKLMPATTERILATAADRLHLDRSTPAQPNTGILYQPSTHPDGVSGGWNGTRKTAVRRAATVAVVAAGLVGGARRRSWTSVSH